MPAGSDRELSDTYDLIKILGEGTYGQVWAATDKQTGDKVGTHRQLLKPPPSAAIRAAGTPLPDVRAAAHTPHPPPAQQVAIKMLQRGMEYDDITKVKREVQLQAKLSHVNIVELRQVSNNAAPAASHSVPAAAAAAAG